ncbi:MAG: nucleoside recognition domain-containing protein, partial [Planctomycetota bacterium]
HLMEDFSARWLAVKLMESDFEAERILLHHAHDRQERALAAFADEVRDAFVAEAQRSPERIIAARRYEYAETLAGACVLRLGGGAKSWSDRVDELACHPVAGVALVIAVLFAVFHLTFQLADGWTWIPWADGWTTPVGVFQWIFDDWLPSITHGMSPGPFRSLLEDGVIGGVGGVISFVPLIFFMFVFLGILEDTGYVARMATVLDRVLRPFGLQGQSVLPLVLSGGIAGGCAVPGVMATRTLRDTRDRLVTMLVAPFMCCGAKIPVMALLVGAFFSAHEGLVLTGLVLLSWVVALGTARLLRLTAIRARQTPFVMELPAYHLPVAGTVLRSAGQRSWLYLQKAGTIILAVNILLWAAMSFPRPDARTYEIERRAARTELADNLSDNPYHPYLTAEELPATLALLERERSGEPLANPDATTPAAFRERLTLVRAAVGRLSPPPPDSDAPEAAEPSATDSSAPVDPDAAEPPALAEAADALARCVRTFASVNERYRADRLRGSLAGRLGRALAPASRLAGFDWRTNVALVGGVSAKELILSGLSTAYSMGRDAAPPPADQAGGSLGRRLRDVEDWTPIRALALMVFVLFYSPCLPALVVIGRESGTWRWAAFAAVFSTIIAFALAVALYQGGQFFAG